MKRWIKALAAILAAVILGYVIWYFTREEAPRDYSTREATIKQIESMVDLCTLDIHEEMAVKDSINGKWIVARQTIKGRVRFDLDSLHIEYRGDTTFVYLPPERVEELEDASPQAYEVFDSWDGSRTVFARTLTAAEENALKRRWQKRTVDRIYSRGYVRRARENAMASLRPLFSAMRGPSGAAGHVMIVDPAPGCYMRIAR